MATITKLTAENIKRLRAVEIEPDGSMVVIGGRNAQGKSSVLDSIEAAIGGKSHCPSVPIRNGENAARVVLETDQLIVTRVFKTNGGETKTSLTVTSKDGGKFGSPQKMLDGLVGELSFDPLEFTRMKPAVQAATLRTLVGLDTSELEQKEKAAYASRTLIGRDLKNAQALLSQTKYDETAPAEVQDFGSIAAVLSEAIQKRDRYQSVEREFQNTEATISEYLEKLDRLRERLETMPKVEDVEIDILQERMLRAQHDNMRVRDNEEHARRKMDLMRCRAKYDQLHDEIQAARAAINEAVASAKYPIEGLAVTDGGVTLNGLPFEQASSSEQLRTSVAMGFALHPELRVLLIRDGSLLDHDALKQVAEMASEHGGQVWVERVSDGDEVSVVIEDGAVKC